MVLAHTIHSVQSSHSINSGLETVSAIFIKLRFIPLIVEPDNWGSILTTSLTLGCSISALFAGGLCKYGKLRMIKLASLLMIVAVAMTMFVFSMWFLTFARFVYGLAIGALTVFVPKFINETTPTELKGPYGGISQIMCCLGILVPSLLALLIPQTIDILEPGFMVTQYWRICWAIPIVIALLQLLMIQCFFPFESP